VVGVPEKDVTIPLPIIQDHQIRIQGSATYLPSDYQDSIKIIGGPAFDAKNFVTAVYQVEEAQKAFDAAIAGEQVKVLIRFS
jgi:threonine dehydrogenase-like Zn-dependent dehydrogenase